MPPAPAVAGPPVSGPVLAAVSQDLTGLPADLTSLDPIATTLNLPDAAEAAVAATDAEEAAKKAEAAAEAAGAALEEDSVKECSDDFGKTLCKIVNAIDNDNTILEEVFQIIKKDSPCGVDVAFVLAKCVEEEIPLPEDPTVFVPAIDDVDDLPSDEPELEIIKDLVEEEEPCVCEISEGDIEKAEEVIEDAFVDPVDVETDPDTGSITVTDKETDTVIDKFTVDTLTDVIEVVEKVEEAESDGEEVEPVVVIDNVQEILEEATEEKAEDGIPPNELPEDDKCCGGCCGCCCGCDDDDHHKK